MLKSIVPIFERGTEDLDRLKRERDDADRLYNDALTALDRAVQRLREMPHPPPPYDDSNVPLINERWELIPLKPADRGGWRGQVRARFWAMVAPLFERQQAFNAAIVDHLNRNVATHRETTRAIASTIAIVREELEKVIDFQSQLIVYAQQITPYVNTKDYELAGLIHRVSTGITSGIDGISDELQKRWESMMATLGTLAVVQRELQTLRRELLRLQGADQAPLPYSESGRSQAAATERVAAPNLNSYKYVAFEDRFRGSQAEIRERLTGYVPSFEGASDVLDVGCGRGEFLDLLGEKRISARGVDLNAEMVALCRERGLDATTGDALSYLLTQGDESLGGLFAAQVVEHFEPDYLIRLLDVAYQKLRPGSKIILETINPACWYAFFSSYIRDITHVRPLHPDTLAHLLSASGFQRVQIRYSVPFPEESKLQPAPSPLGQFGAAEEAEGLSKMAAVFNENVKRLNRLLFTYFDYAAIGERP